MLKLFCSLKHNLALTLSNHKANLVSHFSSNTNSTVRNKGRKKERNKERREKEREKGRKKDILYHYKLKCHNTKVLKYMIYII